MSVLKCYGLANLVKLHQIKVVEPGSSAVVWEFKIPREYILFINTIGNNWFPNTRYELFIDGEKVETIEREIPIEDPLKLDPPMVAFYEVKVLVFNNDKISHAFEFFVDGFVIENPIFA